MFPTIFFVLSIISLTSSQQMMCTYTTVVECSSGNKYECDLFVDNPDGLNNTVTISGNHLLSYTDTSVINVKAVAGISKNVPKSICNQFPNVEVLNFQERKVEIFSMTNCYKVLYVNVGLNLIKELPRDLCQNQPLISTLILYYNQIQVIPSDALTSCTKLEVIDLEHNQISEISPSFFENKPVLREIRIGYNKIKAIQENTFSGLKNLEILLLRFNGMNFIPPNAFISLEKLRWLDVEFNSFTTLSPEWFTNLKSLTYLNLRGNPIITFPSNTFKPLISLVTLELSSCKLTTINAEWFSSLPLLASLLLDNNLITEIPRGSLNASSQFQNVFLQNNKMKRIDSKSFSLQNLQTLSIIELSKNQINAVDKVLLDTPNKLVTFNFLGNVCGNRNINNFYESKETNMAYFKTCFFNFATVTVDLCK